MSLLFEKEMTKADSGVPARRAWRNEVGELNANSLLGTLITQRTIFCLLADSRPELPRELLVSMYQKMVLIRYFEDKVYDLSVQKLVPGTTHLCQGQEAVSVGVNQNLSRKDWMTCTYRGHGHCLAKGVDPNRIMAEMLGKATGCCGGKGGSMHITDASVGALGSFAIVGAGIPVAVGAALTSWYRKSRQVAVAFFGDGAANIGAFHEGLNFASVMKLPVVFVCENNLYGEYTPISKSTPVPDIAGRASAYNIPGVVIDGNDVIEVYSASRSAIERARSGGGPTLLECKTYRQKGHAKTDTGKYRPEEEVQEWLARDPIKLFKNHLISNGSMSEARIEQIEEQQTKIVEAAYKFAQDSPFPNVSEVLTNVYS